MPAKKQTQVRSEPPQTLRGERTKKRIKAFIAKYGATKDVMELKLSDICRSLKITTGAFYFHFKNRDEAIEETIIDEIESVYSTIINEVEEERFEPFVYALIEKLTEFQVGRGRLPRSVQAIINTAPWVYEGWTKARQPLLEKLTRLIAQERANDGLSTEPAEYLASYLLNAVEDLGMDAFQWGNPSLATYAQDRAQWNARNFKLWDWAIRAPL